MQRILLFKLGALGDVLMTTPLVSALRKRYPSATIDYCVGNSYKAVLEGNKDISSIVTFDEQMFYRRNLIQISGLAKRLKKRHYDLVFVLDKHWIFSFCTLLAGIPKRIGFRRDFCFCTSSIPYGKLRHEIDYYLDLGKFVGIRHPDRRLKLSLSPAVERFTKRFSHERYAVVINSGGNNPGEKSKIRMMPDRVFRDIVRMLSTQYKVFLLGGKNDGPYYSSFVLNKNVVNAAGRYTIKQSAALMKYAQKIVTTDCGAMHVASAVNDRIIAVFGPTHPGRKGPLNKKAVLIWKDKKIYDQQYELSGKVPRGNYFSTLSLKDVMKYL